jgi:hypothetical protein
LQVNEKIKELKIIFGSSVGFVGKNIADLLVEG